MPSDDSIQLHPEKGVNPHLMVCPRCGKDNGAIALLGVANGIYTCKSCGLRHVGFAGSPKGGCQECHGHDFKRTELYDYDKVPGGLCAECEAKQKECDEVVRAGGIYFKCTGCGSEGAIKADSKTAKAVREKSGIKAPDPVGLECTECPVCHKDKEEPCPPGSSG